MVPLSPNRTPSIIWVLCSSILRTTEHCSAGRCALNAFGSRFGCLHPLTSFRLYSFLCVPILIYGSELWSLTSSEVTMLERVHWEILRTIQGLPLRCPCKALQSVMGAPSITALIQQRQFNFLHSFPILPSDSLPRLIFEKRLACPSSKESSHLSAY